jgi:hypothetical protein
MTNPVRKLAGTIGLLLLLVVYSLLVSALATSALPEAGGIITTLFYVIAGVGWVPIAMGLVWWMYRRDKAAPPQ